MEFPYKKIVLIEDDDIIRSAFKSLISKSKEYLVVADYPDAETAIENIASDCADIYFVDIELPGMNGIEAIPKIRAGRKSAKIIVVTVYENDELVFKALCEGAIGYLTKNLSPSNILDALNELQSGGAPMSTNIARMVVSSFHKNRETPFTPRELQILEMLSSGKSYSSIADSLFVDKETVKSHLKNIYLKLEVHSKAEAIEKAKKKKYI